jgi:hypothetical protein
MKTKLMAIKIFKVLGLILLLGLLCTLTMVSKPQKNHQLSYKLFYTKTGWGYNILVDTSIVIHQEIIPAAQTQKGFANSLQAGAAAELVIEKIMKHQSPSLNLAEVQTIMTKNELRVNE